MRGYSIKSDFIKFRDISPLKEEVIDSRTIKMMNKKVTKHENYSIPSILNFL